MLVESVVSVVLVGCGVGVSGASRVWCGCVWC